MIYPKALAADYLVQPRATPAPPFLGQRPTPLPQLLIAIGRWQSAQATPGDSDQPAGAALR